MSWEDIIKASAQQVLDMFGKLREIMPEAEEIVRKIDSNEIVTVKEIEDVLDIFEENAVKIIDAWEEAHTKAEMA